MWFHSLVLASVLIICNPKKQTSFPPLINFSGGWWWRREWEQIEKSFKDYLCLVFLDFFSPRPICYKKCARATKFNDSDGGLEKGSESDFLSHISWFCILLIICEKYMSGRNKFSHFLSFIVTCKYTDWNRISFSTVGTHGLQLSYQATFHFWHITVDSRSTVLEEVSSQ